MKSYSIEPFDSVLATFYKEVKGRSEKFSNLPRVTQLEEQKFSASTLIPDLILSPQR